MKKWILILIVALFMGVSLPVYAEEAAAVDSPKFKDVEISHWAYESIMLGVEKGYVKGFPDGTFRPNDSVTVAEFITMSMKSLTDNEAGFVWWSEKYTNVIPPWNKKLLYENTVNFEVGNAGKPWYDNFVQTAKNLELIHEEYNNIYNKALTREQVAEIINKLDAFFNGGIHNKYALIAGAQLLKDYGRVKPNYQESVGAVVIRGIMVGNKGYFNPPAKITRAEAAQICRVLSNKELRQNVSVNLDGVPYSLVPDVGYGPMVMIFENTEMKTVYDVMDQRRGNYSGITDSWAGTLGYYEDVEKQEETFRKKAYFDFSKPGTLYDLLLSFASSNMYNLNLSYIKGRTERVSGELDKFLSLVFKDDAVKVTKYILDAATLARSGENRSEITIIANRQIVVDTHLGTGFMSIGISAYADKK
jgi:hypothetical protein